MCVCVCVYVCVCGLEPRPRVSDSLYAERAVHSRRLLGLQEHQMAAQSLPEPRDRVRRGGAGSTREKTTSRKQLSQAKLGCPTDLHLPPIKAAGVVSCTSLHSSGGRERGLVTGTTHPPPAPPARWPVERNASCDSRDVPCLVFCRARKPVITGSDVPCARFLPQCGSA